jgi:hypothetical protein
MRYLVYIRYLWVTSVLTKTSLAEAHSFVTGTGCIVFCTIASKLLFRSKRVDLWSFSFLLLVPYIDKPTYSTRRRTQSKNRPTANSVFLRDSTDTFIFCSESLSTTSSTPSIHSETSEPMSLDLSPREIVPQVCLINTFSKNYVCLFSTITQEYKQNVDISSEGTSSRHTYTLSLATLAPTSTN